MSITIANGPVSWGVYYGGDPINVPWDRYLDEVAAAGFRYTELGPIGYLPEDQAQLWDKLSRRELTLVGGFIFDALHDPRERERLVVLAHRTCLVLAGQAARHFVIINDLPAERAKTGGRSAAAPSLAPDLRRAFMATIVTLARTARDDHGRTRHILAADCDRRLQAFRDNWSRRFHRELFATGRRRRPRALSGRLISIYCQ